MFRFNEGIEFIVESAVATHDLFPDVCTSNKHNFTGAALTLTRITSNGNVDGDVCRCVMCTSLFLFFNPQYKFSRSLTYSLPNPNPRQCTPKNCEAVKHSYENGVIIITVFFLQKQKSPQVVTTQPVPRKTVRQ